MRISDHTKWPKRKRLRVIRYGFEHEIHLECGHILTWHVGSTGFHEGVNECWSDPTPILHPCGACYYNRLPMFRSPVENMSHWFRDFMQTENIIKE